MIKNKILIIIVFLIIIVAVVLQLSNKEEQTQMQTSIDPVLAPIKKELIKMQNDKAFKQLTKADKLDKTKTVLNKIPDKYKQLKHQYKMAISPLPDIAFYGRVIDQHGQPVKNASVGYTGENAYLSTGGGMGSVNTDDDGYFVINTSGAALELSGVGHPEIDYVSYQSPYASIRSTRNMKEYTVRFVQHDDNRYALNWRNYTDKSKAYLIKVWRFEEYKGALKGSLGAYYNLDDRQYTLNLLGKKYKNRVKEGIHEGHLVVSCTRKVNMKNHRDYGDWTATITPINGGIQETNDLYMNKAPTSGYEPSLSMDMKYGTDDYQFRLLNKRYYFMANNGKIYGSLFVHFEPHANYKNNLCRVEINSYKINPTGSRNLEIKK